MPADQLPDAASPPPGSTSPLDAGSVAAAAARAAHDSDIPAALAADLLTGWIEEVPLSAAAGEIAPYSAKRRAQLAAAFPGEVLVVPAGHPVTRANDTDFSFRVCSDHVWLTGATDPAGVLVITPDGDAVLFCRPRTGRSTLDFFADRTYGELWVGRQPDPDEVGVRLGIECRPLDQLAAALGGARARVLRGVDPVVDAAVPLSGDAAARDDELRAVLAELRLVKDDWEIAELRSAVAATVRGFTDVVGEREAALTHGERWLEGTFWRRARTEGNDVGYSSIVACGPHATTLHWTRNDGRVRDGDLLLLDMGVEARSLYTADVTRTIPVSGSYSAAQGRLHDLVHAAQSAGIAAVRPGAHFMAAHEAASRVLAQGLADWGILRTSVDEALAGAGAGAGLHRRYSLHNTSHMLGIDVHDCSRARAQAYVDGTLSAGMVLTVEPGLYFQADDATVPPELRGLGVRIEDDVLVTADGAENLSAALPRDAASTESWLRAL